jgi:hypothetical protein
MNGTLIAPRLIPAAAGVLACSLLLLPQLRPAQAAKKPKPFNVKGSYTGTYLSQDGTITGPLKLVISGAKKLTPAATQLFITGKITAGTKVKNLKCQGFYNPAERALSINSPVPSGYGVTFTGTLAEDNKTFAGYFSYSHFPVNDDQLLGTATIAKR